MKSSIVACIQVGSQWERESQHTAFFRCIKFKWHNPSNCLTGLIVQASSDLIPTIKTENEVFDPTVHEAISQQPGNGADPGTVIGVTSRGYVLHDRVVRPAQVIVAANE